jgi:hypothetical protein
MPAGSLNAEPTENGVYGSTELLDLDDVRYRNLFTWQPAQGQASVSGHVFFTEHLACAPTGEFSCPPGGLCINDICLFPATDVQVQIIGGDNNTVLTDDEGVYSFPSVRGGTYDVNAYSQRDFVGELFPYGATLEQVVVPDHGSLTDLDLILTRQAQTRDRLVTLKGEVHLEDCDCLSKDEARTYTVELSCRVDDINPNDKLEQKYCADEVGLEIHGDCALQDDNSVHVLLSGALYESVSGSCGATDKEDGFSTDPDMPIVVPPDGMKSTPFSHSRLINKTRCAFHQCDDKAFFRDMSFYNRIAAF